MVWRQALASVSLTGLQGDLKPPGALSGPLGFEMYCPTGMNGLGCQHWKGPRSVGLACYAFPLHGVYLVVSISGGETNTTRHRVGADRSVSRGP